MNPLVQSQLLYGVEAKFPSGGSEKAPRYSDFSKVIEQEFGIKHGIGFLFSQSNDSVSSCAEESDHPND